MFMADLSALIGAPPNPVAAWRRRSEVLAPVVTLRRRNARTAAPYATFQSLYPVQRDAGNVPGGDMVSHFSSNSLDRLNSGARTPKLATTSAHGNLVHILMATMVGSALAQPPIRYFRRTSGAFRTVFREVRHRDGEGYRAGLDRRNDKPHQLRWPSARHAEHEVGENLVVTAHADSGGRRTHP